MKNDKSKGLWALNPEERKVIVQVEDRPAVELTQAQHSPLPWETTADNEGIWAVCFPEGGDIIADNISEADAKLIVRSVNNAGKLAEACRLAFTAIGSSEYLSHSGLDWSKAFDACKAALADWRASQ